jgi:hypothetical protein
MALKACCFHPECSFQPVGAVFISAPMVGCRSTFQISPYFKEALSVQAGKSG